MPSTRCIATGNKFPKLISSEWIAPNATVIGDVETGKYSSIFHGAVLRGDTCAIKIGKKSIIQDNTVLKSSNPSRTETIDIGDNVTIGVNCNIDVCQIEANVVVSDGATVHRGAKIGQNALIAAGAVVQPNTHVPGNQVWAGNPAVYLRDVKLHERENLRLNNTELRELANVMVEETEKTHFEVTRDEIFKEKFALLTNEERFYLEIEQLTYYTDNNTDDFGVEAGFEGFGEHDNENMQRWTAGNAFNKESMDQFYQADMSNYPDVFKIYGENYDKYETMKRKFESEPVAKDVRDPDMNTLKRPGSLRAWVSKWDPDYNTQFKQVGNVSDTNN